MFPYFEKYYYYFQVFSHVTTARPNLPRPPSLAELHLPRPPQLGNCFPKRSETDSGSKLSGTLQAHLANIHPPSLGGKFQSLKSLGSSGGGSQASSSTGVYKNFQISNILRNYSENKYFIERMVLSFLNYE